MKLKFKTPITPNFIKTEIGMIPLKDLDVNEILDYMGIWTSTLIKDWKNKRSK